MISQNIWPELPFEEWKDTLVALHMKMQIPGKVKLVLSPFLNQWWHVAFYLSAAGMTTGLIPYKDILFEINFDFINHDLTVKTTGNQTKTIPLWQCSVAEFYSEFMNALKSLGIDITINTLPAEVPDPIHCDQDMRNAYDKVYVYRWWLIQIQCSKALELFRSAFRGKCSPVQFYWGSFDLNVTCYSGKAASPPEQSGIIMQFSEDEENFSCGFWPGNSNYPKPAFYSYLYPQPKAIGDTKVVPQAGLFNPKLGEFILNYEDVRNSKSPEALISDFLNSTYEHSAKLAGWDIEFFKTKFPNRI